MANVNVQAKEAVTRFVRERLEATGVPPSCREVEEGVGVPRMTAWRYLNKTLAEAGVEPKPAVRGPGPEVRDAVVEQVRAGGTVAGVAREHKVSQGFVRRALRDAQVEVNPKPKVARERDSLNRVLRQVVAMTGSFGVPPTQVEVARALGLSSQTVGHHVATLAHHGYLLAPEDKSGISLRGARFHRDCLTLARAASAPAGSVSGIPPEARPAVLALVRPVVGKPRALDPSESCATAMVVRVAVEHYCARYGRPATANNLREMLGGAVAEEAIRSCLRAGEGVIYERAGASRYGFLPAGGDPLLRPAMRLSKVTARGWTKENYTALQNVLRIVLVS